MFKQTQGSLAGGSVRGLVAGICLLLVLQIAPSLFAQTDTREHSGDGDGRSGCRNPQCHGYGDEHFHQ